MAENRKVNTGAKDIEAWIHRTLGVTEAQLIDIMSYGMLLFALITFVLLQIHKAPYGRYSNPKVWGFGINSKLAWFLQELPSFMVPVLLALFTDISNTSTAGKVLIGMYLLHYFQRTFIYPFKLRGGKATTLTAFVAAVVFCCYNGFIQGGYHLHVSAYPDTWLTDGRFLVGFCLFILGWLINLHSDSILRNLRKPGETGYKIPEGGLFDYVSGANFFGEIVEWTGFAIASWSLPALAFSVYTTCNIGPRAIHHHTWYLQKFDNYPKSRTALVPFLL
ncbi:3-oxo-5-alpha-steroid 4-dehydrogenase 1 [Holothuria leucospilota]|uniref:3-oxo-5alpha-steroid 4-dehydrogenase (NADP(+)) n=1 Tax=Holothuria leucospilota TaxID=206669 RepID=A0A9Q1HFK0_HOLLE|nr:3-oxo-5-alpha-steroid 4-dehydrogenase 1 [Holothuria leucospilota]